MKPTSDVTDRTCQDCGMVLDRHDIGNARLLWMKGHRAMARRILEDSRVTEERARAAIQEHFDFTEAWIVDWEQERDQ